MSMNITSAVESLLYVGLGILLFYGYFFLCHESAKFMLRNSKRDEFDPQSYTMKETGLTLIVFMIGLYVFFWWIDYFKIHEIPAFYFTVTVVLEIIGIILAIVGTFKSR